MSFSTGSQSTQAEINVTPLIDVLLVLLIIFMIIVPLHPNGLRALVPQPATPTSEPPVPDPTTIVVEVHATPSGEPAYSINQQPIERDALMPRLKSIFASRQQRTMFVRADADLDFHTVAEVVGFGRQASVDNIGILTPKDAAN